MANNGKVSNKKLSKAEIENILDEAQNVKEFVNFNKIRLTTKQLSMRSCLQDLFNLYNAS